MIGYVKMDELSYLLGIAHYLTAMILQHKSFLGLVSQDGGISMALFCFWLGSWTCKEKGNLANVCPAMLTSHLAYNP